MQVYKAPIKDYKFLIKDFLNSGLANSVINNSDLNIIAADTLNDAAEKAVKASK